MEFEWWWWFVDGHGPGWIARVVGEMGIVGIDSSSVDDKVVVGRAMILLVLEGMEYRRLNSA